MADTLDRVKKALGITGEYQNDTLKEYITEVKRYLLSAGVPQVIIDSDVSAGVISRGVSDLWNYDTGKLSEYFYQRVIQLIYELENGKYITFNQGDYGQSFPVNIEGITIEDSDVIIFTCNDVVKTYMNESDNCVLITFTEDDTKLFQPGVYTWTLKLQRHDAIVTLVGNGVLVVGGGSDV